MPLNYAKTALLLAVLTGIFVAMGWLLGGGGGMLFAFVVALGMNLYALYRADRMILRMQKAVEVDASSGGQFYQIVRAMAERAELPMPRVFVMQTPQPNAFATGRNPETAVVCASTGLLEMLSPEEVAGVMAHELAHVKNRDTLTMTVAASLGGAISMVAQYLQFGALLGNRGNQRYGWLGFILTALVAPFAAMLVQAGISRSREYSADRLGATICGNPEWLASALLKIQDAVRRIRNIPAEQVPAHAHLFIINPLTGRGMDNLFSTHPSTENRVAALRKLAVEMAAARDERSIASGPAAPWLESQRRGRLS
jgi:heat shock protein HtpX